jgi:hypothetical protein
VHRMTLWRKARKKRIGGVEGVGTACRRRRRQRSANRRYNERSSADIAHTAYLDNMDLQEILDLLPPAHRDKFMSLVSDSTPNKCSAYWHQRRKLNGKRWKEDRTVVHDRRR